MIRLLGLTAVIALSTCAIGEFGLGYSTESWQFFAFYFAVTIPMVPILYLVWIKKVKQKAKPEKEIQHHE